LGKDGLLGGWDNVRGGACAGNTVFLEFTLVEKKRVAFLGCARYFGAVGIPWSTL